MENDGPFDKKQEAEHKSLRNLIEHRKDKNLLGKLGFALIRELPAW